MSRREAWLTAGLVFGVALAVRAWVATQITFPRPEDVAYYVGVARNLVEGRDLTIDAIWSYATPPLTFPRPAFELWLPLPTFLMAIPMAIFGHSFAAAQVASVLEGSAVAVLGWRLAADVAAERELPATRARWLALGTGLAAACYLPLVLASVQPDSTMPFALLVLAVALLGRRVTVEARTGWLVALGALLGLAALTRNEAIWLALAWAIVAWRATRSAGALPGRARAVLPLIGIPAAISIAIYAPWAIRDWAVFGSPLPGQAISNALWLDGRDIFAWASPPTLQGYLAAGLPTLIGQRVEALGHDLGSVLLLLGVPVSAIGLAGLPWTVRGSALGLPAIYAVLAFAVTTLVFPVATTAGTFLHAAGAIHLLVVLSALLVLDAVVERVRTARSWVNPVAWIGPALVVAGSATLSLILVPGDGAAARETGARYAALPSALAQAGAPLPADETPVIADYPIWLATEDGVNAVALPDEPPTDVLDLAAAFHARLVIVDARNGGIWPEVLELGGAGTECFQPVALPAAARDGPLANIVVFRITCGAASLTTSPDPPMTRTGPSG